MPKSICLADKQLYLIVGRLNAGIGHTKFYNSVKDMILMAHDLSLKFYKRWYPTVPCPFDPRDKLAFCFVAVSYL